MAFFDFTTKTHWTSNFERFFPIYWISIIKFGSFSIEEQKEERQNVVSCWMRWKSIVICAINDLLYDTISCLTTINSGQITFASTVFSVQCSSHQSTLCLFFFCDVSLSLSLLFPSKISCDIRKWKQQTQQLGNKMCQVCNSHWLQATWAYWINLHRRSTCASFSFGFYFFPPIFLISFLCIIQAGHRRANETYVMKFCRIFKANHRKILG